VTTASGSVHFRENVFVKHSNGTLGVGVFYHGGLPIIQGVDSVNLRGVVEIQSTRQEDQRPVRDSDKSEPVCERMNLSAARELTSQPPWKRRRS
jgi:hypothetical protein